MAQTCDLNGIKTALKTLFDAANTPGYDPIDLSNGLTQRVQKVLKVNPIMIPPQASFFPFVTCYIDGKVNTGEEIAKDQLNMKRSAEITVTVVGAVFNSNIKTNLEDPADEDICNLMENVELVLRANYNLGGVIKWQKMSSVKYYSSPVNVNNHIRAGILELTCRTIY